MSPRSSVEEKKRQHNQDGRDKTGGKRSSVVMEVSTSREKRGKKAGKRPSRGFGDMRKVVLGMDVH